MNSLMEMYNGVLQKVKSISEQIHKIEEDVAALRKEKDNDVPARILKLEEQLVKIDEYILKIKGFQEIAKKNLESQNILTIEAPPGYRVNLNRLRKWATMIDPSSSNDPYAQRILAVAKCDEVFLEQKKAEFTARIAELKAKGDGGLGYQIEELEKQKEQLQKDMVQLAHSKEVADLANKVLAENKEFWHEKSPERYQSATSSTRGFAPGAYAAPLPFAETEKEFLKDLFGKFYDEVNGRILLPAEISLEKEFVITISCAPTKDKSLDKGIQNLILNIIDNSPAGLQKVYIIDGVRFNSSSVGTLKQLEDTFALAQIPRNQDQITASLESIVSSFADIDEILGDCDSVKLYNETIAKKDSKKIPLSTVVLYGWPNAYEGRNKELLTKIMTNYERYGVSIIAVSYKKTEGIDEDENNNLPEYATHNAIHIRMFQNDTTISMPDEKPKVFVWYVLNDVLSKEYVASLKEHKIEKKVIGSEYIKRYSLEEYPKYEKGKKSISLPFGVDAKDKAHSIAFDNENFASYLMGASGSGKSTLLHTLITGILLNYHPDDVELWLADFKMSEFAQYMDPLPPHVKYILLDESPELVYDLLDKLTEKMMERQRFFMQNRKLKKVENVKSIHMPIIFVILDEFSIMSQAVAESGAYKLKLQNLLAKGRALGIKFIFASQDFSKGITGLTSTAKDQIQSRIAMKNTVSEINDTLELSVNMKTDQVKNWMEAIPPYYALMKYREGENVRVKRVNVMYFKGGAEDAYAPQRRLIEKLNKNMKAVAEFSESNVDVYVDKQPVLVDGNSYDAFDANVLAAKIKSLTNGSEFNGDEIFAYVGTPRLMTKYKEIVVTPEARQNFLLLCDYNESNCGTAVVTSIMKSFELQGRKAVVWSYERSKILKKAKDHAWVSYETVSELGAICTQIRQLKDMIQNDTVEEGKLIVLLGFENICADFDFLADAKPQNKKSSNKVTVNMATEVAVESSSFIVDTTEEDEETAKMRQEYLESIASEEEDAEEDDNLELLSMEEILRMMNDEENVDAEAAEEDVEVIADVEEAEVAEEMEEAEEATEAETETEVDANADTEEDSVELLELESAVYNAKADLKYIVQHGSRKGIHFLLYLNAYTDLKVTGMKEELFRHRLAFNIPAEESRVLFGPGHTSLPEHICMYGDMLERFSFRPYLHQGISWDGWSVDESNKVINPFD